jgi:uncharacterized protein with PIN domain
MSGTPRFLCDEMLGKLARELRALGYDAAYARDRPDRAILERATTEDRLLVTRDRQLADRAGSRALLLATKDPAEQLAALVDRLELAPTAEAFLTRCLACNVELVAADRPEQLPDSQAGVDHWRCPECDRLYWPGTHARDMLERLREHLPADLDRDRALDALGGEGDGERKA